MLYYLTTREWGLSDLENRHVKFSRFDERTHARRPWPVGLPPQLRAGAVRPGRPLSSRAF